MAHARKQIRDAILTQITGLTTTGARAYASRVWSMGSDKLPGLIVYTIKEDAEITTIGSTRNSYRQLLVAIEAHVKGTSPDDMIDTIAAEVEAVLGDDHALGGLTKDIFYAGADIDLNGDGDQKVAVATLNYVVEYQVDEDDAEVLT